VGRILSIDYGKKRIGLALSDPMKILASPYKTLQTGKNHAETVSFLQKEIEVNNVEKIVMGLPLHLSNKESELSEEVRALAALLEEKTSLPLVLWDERLTSKEVDRVMRAGDVKRKKRAQHVDTLSATLILQNYLDSLSF